ncbi:hypothetical protein LCGC14_2294690, partial [marine sediment metagenome]
RIQGREQARVRDHGEDRSVPSRGRDRRRVRDAGSREKAIDKIELDVLNSHDFGPKDEDQTVAFQAALQKAVLEGARPQIIPRLLQTVFYDLIREDLWDGLKRYQFPVVDFKRLRSHCILRTKQFAPTLF